MIKIISLPGDLKKKLKQYKNSNIIVPLFPFLDLQRLIWMKNSYYLNFLKSKSVDFHYLWANASSTPSLWARAKQA